MATTIWEVSADGYLKKPDTQAKEGKMLLSINAGTKRFSIFLSEDRPFGWDKMNANREKGVDEYVGTRGEAVIHMDLEQMRALAERVLKVIELG